MYNELMRKRKMKALLFLTILTFSNFINAAEITVIKFGDSEESNKFGLQGWNTVLIDKYVKYTGTGPGGVWTHVGVAKNYNFQGIKGVERKFSIGEKIEVIWYNHGDQAFTLNPLISFEDPDRHKPELGEDGTWYEMEGVVIPPGESAKTSYTINEESQGTYSLINIATAGKTTQTVLCNKIILVTP